MTSENEKAQKNRKSVVVIGGQYGSEGKGQFVGYLARTGKYSAAVRTGGPNAGHTVTENRNEYKMRHIPTAWVQPGMNLYLGPGGLIDIDVLSEEIAMVPLNVGSRFWIDENCTIITVEHKGQESELKGKVGSTREGIGAARADKMMRSAQLASGMAGFDSRVVDVPNALARERAVIVESTQGFGLSLESSGNYPFVTSANITPGHVLGEAGLSSRIDHKVVVVMRTYPIRVAGNSGPMKGELTWGGLSKSTNGHIPIGGERTTVTKLVRRIGGWDSQLAARMTMICKPDLVCLTFLDYVFPELANLEGGELMAMLNDPSKEYIDYLEARQRDCGAAIRWVGTGPGKITDIYGEYQ